MASNRARLISMMRAPLGIALSNVPVRSFGLLGGFWRVHMVFQNVRPGTVLTYQLSYNSAGQPLGGVQPLGTVGSDGSLDYQSLDIDNPGDPYWFPASVTNTFDIYQDGVYRVSFSISS